MFQVLIVDDESAEREGLFSLLNKYQYPFEITLRDNGQSAMDVLRERRFDLLISDIVMPQMDGLTLCTQALALYPQITTVISSAYSDFKYTQAAIRIGVDDYILKPIVVESFQGTMERCIQLMRKRSQSDDRSSLNAMEENTDHVIQEIKHLIQAHFAEDIGLEWVAQRMYLSPGYLSTVFKRKTDRTITQYVTLCRMRRACYLLRHTNIKVNQIGQDVGYPNPSYFCYLFRKIFSISPNQFREGVTEDVMAKIESTLE